MTHIGRELAAARSRTGLTQAALAHKLGVLQSRISQIEHEENPRLDTVQSYARALGLELMLVPSRQLSRVRAMLRGDDTAPDGDKDASRFPSLADLMGDTSKGTARSRPRRDSSR